MSNVPPRQARARSEKANGVTRGSSEESDCEPQTARKAWPEALNRQFETPMKSEEESPLHRPVKRQRLFQTTSSQSATDCLSMGNCTPGPSRRSNGTASKGDWARPSHKKTSRIVDIVYRLLKGSKVKAIWKATRRCSGLTVQWGPMFFRSFSWKLYSLKAIALK